MGYIILHNRQSAVSRAFVAALPADGGHTIIEWYTEAGKVAEYLADHPGLYPSDFPSVAIPVGERTVAESMGPSGETVPEHVVPAHVVLVCCPASIAEAEATAQAEG